MSNEPRTKIELSEELAREYDRRFTPMEAYRKRIWRVLLDDFFQPLIGEGKVILDLGCGWGEFINGIRAEKRFGMDLNPESPRHLDSGVIFLNQDCSSKWDLEDNSLDVVFTSNFFEHLPDKNCLKRTIGEALRCLRPGGRIICMGPNIRVVKGGYWDFFDHYVCLTERSLAEGLELGGLRCIRAVDRFLPYTMVGKKEASPWMVKFYLKVPFLWRLFGGQFLVIGEKSALSHR